MKALLAMLCSLALQASCLADDKPVQFYAQLIRASDREAPEMTHWKPVGPKLSRQLSPKFRWKNYWEVSRDKVDVKPGQTARIRLNPDRAVEIEVRNNQDSEIRLYHKGVLVRKCRQPLQCPMSIMGGTRENDESWFVVVRRDRPTG